MPARAARNHRGCHRGGTGAAGTHGKGEIGARQLHAPLTWASADSVSRSSPMLQHAVNDGDGGRNRTLGRMIASTLSAMSRLPG